MKKNQQLAKQVDQVHEAWARANGYRDKQQATSLKLQASEKKSGKPQAPSSKLQLQAASVKLQDLRAAEKFHGARTKVLNADKSIVRMLHVKGNLMR